MRRTASEIIRNLENRVARLEKSSTQSKSKKAGRRYDDFDRLASGAVDLRYVHELAKTKLSNRNVVDVQRGKDLTGRDMVSISLSNGVEISYSKYHNILMTTSTGDALDIGNPPHEMMNEQMTSDIAKYSRF